MSDLQKRHPNWGKKEWIALASINAKSLDKAQEKIERLTALVKRGESVVEDFMSNIGHCALQNYGKKEWMALNDFLIESAAIKGEVK